MDAFVTDCMTAERLQSIHLSDLVRMHQDARVMATLGGLRSEEQTQEFLNRNLAHWDRHGYGLWVFRDKNSGDFLGRAGLRHVHIGGHDEIELAYALCTDFWGRGFATEMARAILRVGFEELGLRDVVCFTLTANLASRRVMEKTGFTFEREITHAGQPHALYRLRA